MAASSTRPRYVAPARSTARCARSNSRSPAPRRAATSTPSPPAGANTRLLIVDHLTPGTALILPLAEIAARVPRPRRAGAGRRRARARQHRRRHRLVRRRLVRRQPAQVGVGAAQCGPAVGRQEHQTYLHPTVISWGLDHGIAAEFDLLGTRDPVALPHRTVRDRFDERVRRRRGRGSDLSPTTTTWRGGPASTWPIGGARVHHARGDDRLDGQRAPACRVRVDRDDAERVRAASRPKASRSALRRPDELTTRISAQIYCDRTDIERLGDAVVKLPM